MRCPSPAPASPDAYAGIGDQSGARSAAQGRATPGATGGGGGVAVGSTGGSNAAPKSGGPGASTSAAGRSDGAAAPGIIYGSGPNKSGVWQRSNSLVSGVAQVSSCFGSMHCMDSMPTMII